jgi:hypothetical protein
MHVNNSKRMSVGKSKRIQALMKKPGAGVRGRPTVLTPCPFCKAEFGARDFRSHMPVCPKRYIGKSGSGDDGDEGDGCIFEYQRGANSGLKGGENDALDQERAVKN